MGLLQKYKKGITGCGYTDNKYTMLKKIGFSY